MAVASSSLRFKSLYVARFVIEISGILLVIGALFLLLLAYMEPEGRHGRGGVKSFGILASLMLADGIGLILPQSWMKIACSLLLAGSGVWLFYEDAFRNANLPIYCLSVVPLLMAVWLHKGYRDLNVRRLPNGKASLITNMEPYRFATATTTTRPSNERQEH